MAENAENFDSARNKRGIVIASIVAVIALIVGHILPPIAVFAMKLLPNGAHADYRFVSDNSMVMNLWSLLDPDLDPELQSQTTCVDTLGMTCTHLEGPAELRQTITTSSTDKFMETNVDSILRVLIGGQPYADYEDHSRVQRDSTYPVPEPVATKLFTIPPLDTGVPVGEHQLQGLQYLFPFATERRSYDYADPLAWGTIPLDYVDPVESSGLRAYEFTAHAPVSNLIETVVETHNKSGVPGAPTAEEIAGMDPVTAIQAALRLDDDTTEGVRFVTSGNAERFFTPEEMDRFGYVEGQKVALQPFYTSDRTFIVEPKTGTVLDQKVHVNIFLAENKLQAREMVDADLNYTVRTVFRADYQFDEATKQAQLESAQPTLKNIRILQVSSWIASMVLVAALAALAWLLLRCRKYRHQQA